MPATIVVDRHGRRLANRRIVPDGGRVVVPLPFRDARAVHTQRAFMRDAEPRVLHRPGYVQSVMGDDFAATNSNEKSQSASEAARQDWINRTSNAWKQTWQQMPPSAHKPKPGLASHDDLEFSHDAKISRPTDPSEAAYLRMKQRVSDAWRTPTDDNAEGMATPDLPDDIAQLPLVQQNAYYEAYNKHMEENPDADDEECDAAGRAALEPRDSADAAAHLETVRASYHADYVRRITNAWKT